jgi:lipase chaperone LimK
VRRAALVLAVLLLLCAVAARWSHRRDAGGIRHTTSASPVARPAPGAAPAAALDEGDAAPVTLGPRPRSLRGTRVDGGLAVDAGGRFMATPDARRLFDYFLATAGEEPPERIRARIVSAIEQRLSGDAARDATALLDRYLAYRERARHTATREELLATRRETLGADADALFADVTPLEEMAVEVARTASDPGLSPDERAAQRAALEATLPPSLQNTRAQVLAPLTLIQEEAALRAAGAAPDAIRALREQMAGVEAADRLEALDRARADWDARVASYREARVAIETDPSLSADARARAVADLLATRFSGPERTRVAALDRIAAGAPSPEARAATPPR